ncbi:MAG: PilN domain-containing protein, partial [Methylophilaceae bacterium]
TIVAGFLCYQSLQKELMAYQTSTNANPGQQQSLSNSPELNDAISHAIKTQQSLSYPWLKLLSHLETIKQTHKNIDFLNVVPNKAKSEMHLEGEAKSFDEITNLLNALKANEAFQDAVLVNQYLVEPDSPRENNGKPLYTFNLLLKW